MNYYIIDDDIAIVEILEDIIEEQGIGTVVGSGTDPLLAEDEIRRIRPDIVLADLLMKELDGISLIRRIRPQLPQTAFVMISKVTDKDMVSQAYEAGAEFFISKPINLIEVRNVLENVAEKVRLRSMMSGILNIVGNDAAPPVRPEPDAAPRRDAPQVLPEKDLLRNVAVILTVLGITGEKGTRDIRQLAGYMLTNGVPYSKDVLETVAQQNGDTVKNVEQRARRAMKKALTNAAADALDDFGSDLAEGYARYVFDFKAIRDEMNYLQGRSAYGGRINFAKFMDGLIVYNDSV